MVKAYTLSREEKVTLSAIVGKRLLSYRLNDIDSSSFEIFVLRFPDADLEIATVEIDDAADQFADTNTTNVILRPDRDSWSRVGETKPYNGIPSGQFKDYPVGAEATGVSVIVEKLSHGDADCEFTRGIIIEIGNESIVFDKGAYNWGNIWNVRRSPSSGISLPKAEFDPVEERDTSSVTCIERIA